MLSILFSLSFGATLGGFGSWLWAFNPLFIEMRKVRKGEKLTDVAFNPLFIEKGWNLVHFVRENKELSILFSLSKRILGVSEDELKPYLSILFSLRVNVDLLIRLEEWVFQSSFH